MSDVKHEFAKKHIKQVVFHRQEITSLVIIPLFVVKIWRLQVILSIIIDYSLYTDIGNCAFCIRSLKANVYQF